MKMNVCAGPKNNDDDLGGLQKSKPAGPSEAGFGEFLACTVDSESVIECCSHITKYIAKLLCFWNLR